MVLLVAGTIALHNQGLYYAQQTYFSVYYFNLFGVIPIPGTYTILTAIFINLLCKLIIDKWHVKKTGSLVTHISGLLLLAGGFLTANFSHEGYIDLNEQNTINYISDYNNIELAVNNVIFDNNSIKVNHILKNSDLAFTIQITDYCKHCQLITDKTNSNNKYLRQLPKPKDTEQSSTIIGLNILGNNSGKKINNKTIYLNLNNQKPYNIIITEDSLSRGLAAGANINTRNKMTPAAKPLNASSSCSGNCYSNVYDLNLRHQRKNLPFSIKLNKFIHETHPGTEVAKSYESEVTLIENNNSRWNSNISMNNPLRYKGYTLYQSSYYIEDNKYNSVLAVVYNIGQSFPYIASIVMCIGILLHLLQRLPKLIRKPS